MLKRVLAIIAMLCAAASFAAVDVNKANEAELDGIKGIGPGISSKILDERKSNGNFKDWDDFISRVGGVGEKSAAKFSSEGLTVNGKKYSAAAATKAEPKNPKKPASNQAADRKAKSSAEKAPVTAAPATAASASKN